MSKIDTLYAAKELSARDVVYVASIWEDHPKLASKVQKQIKAGDNFDPAAQKAVINEWESAVKYFTDLAPVAQNFILEHAEELASDLALMVKKSASYSRLSGNFWTYLSENFASLPKALVSELSERADVPRAFAPKSVKANSDVPVRTRRSRADVDSDEEEKPRRSSSRREAAPIEKSSRRSSSTSPEKSRRHVSESDSDSDVKPTVRKHRHSHTEEKSREKSSSARRQFSRSRATDESDVKVVKSVKQVMRNTNRPGKLLK